MSKEIHFYESTYVFPMPWENKFVWWTWDETKAAIEEQRPEIHTTQMCMLSNTLILNGYRMFVHQNDGFVYEITLKESAGDNRPFTCRVAQNVYAMWASDVFRSEAWAVQHGQPTS